MKVRHVLRRPPVTVRFYTGSKRFQMGPSAIQTANVIVSSFHTADLAPYRGRR